MLLRLKFSFVEWVTLINELDIVIYSDRMRVVMLIMDTNWCIVGHRISLLFESFLLVRIHYLFSGFLFTLFNELVS